MMPNSRLAQHIMLNISVLPDDGIWLTIRLYFAIVMDMKRHFLPEEARNL